MIVTRRYVKMEADLAALRARSARELRPLRGIATIRGDVDEILAEIKAEQAAV